ncbi:MAG: ABC transporter permease [Candidatus Paceibacterota bacterium]|jgi:putative ABC transport system permease protein|nr:ABC transporter permease [bacterium]
MKFLDLFEEIYSALLANKARSGLTILGIVIGIGSVIAMIAIGQGSQSSIESSIQSLGSNLLLITPGAQRGMGVQVSQGRGSSQTLTKDDAEAISSLSSVLAVSPEVSGRYQVTAKGTNTNTTINGVVSAYPTVRNVEVETGNFITDQNVKSMSKVAVIGPSVRDDLFGEDVDSSGVIGQTIRIKSINFTIVGITKEKGGSGFNNQDDVIYIPITVSQQYLTGGNYVSTIAVQASSQEEMTVLQTDITTLLLDRHNVSTADFSIMNQADIVATASSVTNTFTMLLGSVAGISLVVGGIGIMNMMLTTVTERTREIGLRKAIGAKRKDINFQFLGEAIMLTFTGGIIGIILGCLVSFVAYQFFSLATQVSTFSVVLSFGVSGAIGIIFGYYPANRASKLNPIEALRYE